MALRLIVVNRARQYQRKVINQSPIWLRRTRFPIQKAKMMTI
ncbi:Uncharacterised protein [Vibrio cholerae]|nr:Uncharacterised protein [Vibrio cholerae]